MVADTFLALDISSAHFHAQITIPDTAADAIDEAIEAAVDAGVPFLTAAALVLNELVDWLARDLQEARLDFVDNVEFAAKRAAGRRGG